MVEINNLTNFSVDKKFFAGVAKKVLSGENKRRENLSVAFVSPGEIRRLNKQYRKKDKPTDVLSFEKALGFKEEFAEIIICPSVVRESVKKSGFSFREELAKVLIHGILHILGYEHENSEKERKKMFEKQERYFSKIKLSIIIFNYQKRRPCRRH